MASPLDIQLARSNDLREEANVEYNRFAKSTKHQISRFGEFR